MHIDQHNYEEFFLLYVDGELSATDKQAVEQFVQANPGLAEELEMLLQMRLTDEPVLFEGKDILFRNETAEINLHNYEEQFLLYVDNELNTVSKEKVETFVLQHPALQESFTLLKQTRLASEIIVFPDKSSLYRKEEKEKPIFYLHWQRIAVAAALIGFAVLVWTIFPADKSLNTNTAKLELKNGDVSQQNNQGSIITGNNNAAIASKNNTAELTANTIAKGQQQGIDRNGINTIDPAVIENIEHNTNSLLAQNTTDATVGSLKREEIITNPVEAAEKTQFSQKIPSANTTLANTDMVKVAHTEETDNTERIAQQTVYKELDTDDEKKSLYLGSLEINKDKLRGFFRKAGSLFRGKAKQQEEEKTESATPSTTRSLK